MKGKFIYKSPKILPKGKDMNGIFDYFLNKNINPIDTFLNIKTRGDFKEDDPNSVITWKQTGKGKWASDNQINGWISLHFGANPLKMTHFSFKSVNGYVYATEFNLYGLKNEDDWVLIQKYTSNDYCKPTTNYEGLLVCDGNYVETWKLNNTAYYIAYKWEETKSIDSSAHYLSMQGLEVFGQLNPFICFEKHSFPFKICIFIDIFILQTKS